MDNTSVCIWSNAMDDALIEAFHHYHTLENRVGETFTTHAIDNIVKEMQSKFPNKITIEWEILKYNLASVMTPFKIGWADLHGILSQIYGMPNLKYGIT